MKMLWMLISRRSKITNNHRIELARLRNPAVHKVLRDFFFCVTEMYVKKIH